jgi:hypothetical protein
MPGWLCLDPAQVYEFGKEVPMMRRLMPLLALCIAFSASAAELVEDDGYIYDEACEICPALAEAHRDGNLEFLPPSADVDVASVLVLLEGKLGLALHLAASAVGMAKAPGLFSIGDIPIGQMLMQHLADEVLEAIVDRQDEAFPVRVDSVEFLIEVTRLSNDFIRSAMPEGNTYHYLEGFENMEAHVADALEAMVTCREELERRDYQDILSSSRRAHAALLAAQGHGGQGLVPGLRAMVDAVGSDRAIVRVGESIQEAIDRLEPGGTILLEPGVYHESIVIDRSLTILGASFEQGLGPVSLVTVIEGSPTRCQVQIDAGLDESAETPQERLNVVIEGTKFQGGLTGIEVGAGASVILTDVTVSGEVAGIVATGDAVVKAESSKIWWADTGVLISEDAACELTRCRIERNSGSDAPSAAVFALGNACLLLDDCDIVQNDTVDLLLLDSVHAEIRDCRIEGNRGGLAVMHRTDDGRLVAAEPKDIVSVVIRGTEWEGVPRGPGSSINGCGNTIPGPGEPGANTDHGIYSEGFEYLLDPCS